MLILIIYRAVCVHHLNQVKITKKEYLGGNKLLSIHLTVLCIAFPRVFQTGAESFDCKDSKGSELT